MMIFPSDSEEGERMKRHEVDDNVPNASHMHYNSDFELPLF